MCQEEGLSLYLLGSEPGAVGRRRRGAAALVPASSRCAAPTTATSASAPRTPSACIEHLAETKPDILLVGMGTPQQELWVEQNQDRIDASVVWTVGALFDYVSARVPRAPHWIADNGFEWIFRLAVEPRRMWRRYLLGNPAFLYRVLEERRRPGR